MAVHTSSDTQDPKHIKFRTWLLMFLAGVLASGVFVFYGLFHLALGLQFIVVARAYFLISAVTLAVCPALYWARNPQLVARDKGRRLFIVIGTYMCLVGMIDVYSAGAAGLIPPQDVRPFSIVLTFMLGLSCWAAYYLRGVTSLKEKNGGDR